jgi:hypothetical protein
MIVALAVALISSRAQALHSRFPTRWVVSGDRSAAARAVQANALGQLHRMLAGR